MRARFDRFVECVKYCPPQSGVGNYRLESASKVATDSMETVAGTRSRPRFTRTPTQRWSRWGQDGQAGRPGAGSGLASVICLPGPAGGAAAGPL